MRSLTMLFLITSLKGLLGSGDSELVFKVSTRKAVTSGGGLGAENLIQENALFLGNDIACDEKEGERLDDAVTS